MSSKNVRETLLASFLLRRPMPELVAHEAVPAKHARKHRSAARPNLKTFPPLTDTDFLQAFDGERIETGFDSG